LKRNLDSTKSYWEWNIQQIESVSITDNVVDLMVSKIKKLSQKTQRILKLAACIGNHFNLEILTIINNKSDIITAQELQSALDQCLVIPLNKNYKIPLLWNAEDWSNSKLKDAVYCSSDIHYQFLHDRVQQAAYSLISEEEKKYFHLQIGRILLENYQDHQLQDKIFDIVNQLNKGATLITDQLEINELANLNLKAGKKAKVSTAYDLTLKYLENGLELLTLKSWKTDYKLTLEIYVETLEALYLNTKFSQIEELSDTILKEARDIFDKLKVYEIKIIYYFTIFQPQKAIDIAINILRELGIKFSLQDNEIRKRISNRRKSIKLLLKNKSIEDLADHFLMTDPKKLAAIKIMQQIRSASNSINFLLLTELILTLVHLCIKYGNPPQACTIYAFYGMLVSGIMTDIDYGYQFGKLAIKLLEQDNNQKFQPEIIFLYYAYMWCWKNPINNQLM
ncbi:hypothetical protein GNF10_36485, partial [Nostoc sp. UCD121]|nr:hypothetical protein [Nostoc sp. UCD121]